MTRETENFKAAKRFFKNKIPVHLLKRDRKWLNGMIVEFADEFFIIDEIRWGRRVVFFPELYHIEKMQEDD